MADDPASWPDWRPPTEFPRLGVTVLVTVRDETGREWVDFGTRLAGGQWRAIYRQWAYPLVDKGGPRAGRYFIGDQIAMELDVLEVVAWMPVPPPAAAEAAPRETVKAKSYPTKEVKNQASDPKGKT